MEKTCSKDSETYLFAQKNNYFGHLRLVLCFVPIFLSIFLENNISTKFWHKRKPSVLFKKFAFSHKKFSKLRKGLKVAKKILEAW
jgi:hypothetical protein